MTEVDGRVELLRGVYDRWAQGDFNTPEVFTEDVEVVWAAEMPDARVDRGLAEMGRSLYRMYEAAERMSIAAESFHPSGDQVLALIEVRIVGKGSGAETVQPAAHLWTMPGDRATKIVGFFDRSAAFEAAGIS